jgi:hypothetical protein
MKTEKNEEQRPFEGMHRCCPPWPEHRDYPGALFEKVQKVIRRPYDVWAGRSWTGGVNCFIDVVAPVSEKYEPSSSDYDDWGDGDSSGAEQGRSSMSKHKPVVRPRRRAQVLGLAAAQALCASLSLGIRWEERLTGILSFCRPVPPRAFTASRMGGLGGRAKHNCFPFCSRI